VFYFLILLQQGSPSVIIDATLTRNFKRTYTIVLNPRSSTRVAVLHNPVSQRKEDISRAQINNRPNLHIPNDPQGVQFVAPMRFSVFAVAAALAQPTLAFQSRRVVYRKPTLLSASTFSKNDEASAAAADPPPNTFISVNFNAASKVNGGKVNGRTSAEIEAELAGGKVLEGGKVIDFEAVKGPSHAEQALREARQQVLQLQSRVSGDSNIPVGILGINDDVIQEVGHPLGTFASDKGVQKCASWLRSQAPAGRLKDAGENAASPIIFSDQDKATFQSIMEKAYAESGEVTGAFAKTFYMGTMLLPEKAREAIWAIYVWCRRTDEIVDAPRDNDQEMLRDLSAWEMRLEKLWDAGEVVDVYDLCLLDVRIRYPTMSITPFMDMIRGMLMDVPDLGQDRYDTFDELHLYCYRVAGTVGLMSLPIFGTAPGITYEQARYVVGRRS
jgi:Squalene/phytoene synthase